jgi:hypothetical protein
MQNMTPKQKFESMKTPLHWNVSNECHADLVRLGRHSANGEIENGDESVCELLSVYRFIDEQTAEELVRYGME